MTPQLEVESDLPRDCAWRHVMRAAKGGQKVIERIIVREVDYRDLCTPFVFIAMEDVVMPDGEIEEMTRCNPGRIVIVVFGTGRRYADQGGAVVAPAIEATESM